MASQLVSHPEPLTRFSPELSVNILNLRLLSRASYSSGYGFRLPARTRGRALMCSDSSSRKWNVPVLSSDEVVERLKQAREGKEFLAMYSSVVVGFVTTDKYKLFISAVFVS